MPRKFIDKKKAATFHLVHRSHRDPLINDPESSSRVLKYVPPTNSKTVPGSSKDPAVTEGAKGPITRSILEETVDVDAVRENEGQAAEYGIYFDDSEYDYMQHLRSVGDVPDGILLEAPANNKGKGKAKEVVFGEKLGLPKEVLPSEEGGYKIESMQNIPDSLRGFQPDMDPDLREVLEILEDDLPQPPSTTEDSDNEDPEDIFAQLVQSGERPVHETAPLDADEFPDNEYEGYESDDTIKAGIQGSEYLKEMAQWKAVPTQQGMKAKVLDKEDVNSMGGDDSVVGGETESMFSRTSNANTHRTSKQRRKRRQRLGGAYSEAGTDYSMTSSANFRNEGLTSLDDRFDKILETYNEDDSESVISEKPPRKEFKESKQFDAIMDEFLGGYKVLGKRMVKKSANGVSGMTELDDIRRELGKARIS